MKYLKELDIIHEKGYRYAGHYMPHDAKKRMGNINLVLGQF